MCVSGAVPVAAELWTTSPSAGDESVELEVWSSTSVMPGVEEILFVLVYAFIKSFCVLSAAVCICVNAEDV